MFQALFNTLPPYENKSHGGFIQGLIGRCWGVLYKKYKILLLDEGIKNYNFEGAQPLH